MSCKHVEPGCLLSHIFLIVIHNGLLMHLSGQATLNCSVSNLVCKFSNSDHAFVTGSLFHGSSQLHLVCKVEDSIVQLLFLNGFLFRSYASEVKKC